MAAIEPQAAEPEVLVETSHDLPLVSFSVASTSGSLLDPAGLEGLTRLTETIETRKKKRNDIEQDTMIQIRNKNLDTERQALDIDRELEYARLQQERELEIKRATQKAEVTRERAAKEQEAERAQIQAKEAIDRARIAAERAVEQERIERERNIEELEIERRYADAEKEAKARELERLQAELGMVCYNAPGQRRKPPIAAVTASGSSSTRK